MVYELKKISEAPTHLDPINDFEAIERERRNWYLAIDDKGRECAIKNPITWPWVQRRPGVWYRIKPNPIDVTDALEDMRRNRKAHG